MMIETVLSCGALVKVSVSCRIHPKNTKERSEIALAYFRNYRSLNVHANVFLV